MSRRCDTCHEPTTPETTYAVLQQCRHGGTFRVEACDECATWIQYYEAHNVFCYPCECETLCIDDERMYDN